MASTSTAGSAAPTRPLVLHSTLARVHVPVPASPLSAWVASEVVAQEFHDAGLDADDAPLALEENDDGTVSAPAGATVEAQVKLLARFLGFVADKVAAAAGQGELATVLVAAYGRFNELFLAADNVHTVTQAYEPVSRAEVLKAYYKAFAVARAALGDAVQVAHPSALFEAAKNGSAELYGLFGGQGVNEFYFNELQSLYDIYTPFIDSLLSRVSDLLVSLATKSDFPYYTQGLELYAWLTGAAPRPTVDYLASVPLSLPLIGVAQLAQYVVSCRVADLSPGEMRASFKGATGHSQGVVSAVAVATASTWDELEDAILKAVKLLFFIGLRGQEAFPLLAIEPHIVADAVANNESTPSPMLTVSGLSEKALSGHITKVNKHLPANSQVGISLYNAATSFVVTGPAKALYGLATALRKVMAPAGLDQSKTPFSKRKAVFTMRFLPVNVPYHSPYLAGATAKLIKEDLGSADLFTPAALGISIYHTEDGSDLRKLGSSLDASLCDQIFTQHIHWAKTCDFPATATHAIDFGPGGTSGVGFLAARVLEGRGVRTVVVTTTKGEAELYDARRIRREPIWVKECSPKLVKTLDGKVHIDTPFSRLLGKPPIMVAGMTPTTVGANLVAATLNAGFHIELAGGGHYNAKALRAKVAEIQRRVKPGVGISLNALYINQRQFTFQFPLWQEMRREGLPIEGFCVAAGIPSSEKATEIISALKAAGIKHVSFKPGSVEGIRQVVNIAAANPDYPIILQWTGGRAGGHHSCEDFHQPIISTYASIRQHRNISLIAGSGFGGAEDVWPYISGDWASAFGVQPMPFDGVLYASRVMVAKEADTSASVKQLIVEAAGVGDAEWEGTYDKPTGGILTVRSELGEPIHKIATRGVKLWREFDDTVFALPRDKRAAWLESKKDYVIDRLNKDFNKPWFGAKADGTVVSDIGQMTYEEITNRMVRLMYVSKQERWVDVSLRNLVGDWLRRVEERFAGVDGIRTKESLLQSFTALDKPTATVAEFFDAYPRAKSQLVAAEDKAYFLNITQRPGQKPVPFIPVLDNSFEVWFKKDSLWAAEDIDAVFDQDPQRVCILQGPMAVKHSTVADEPVGDILGNIESLLAKRILERYYGDDEKNVPTIDYIGAKGPSGVAGTRTLKVSAALPAVDAWLDEIAGDASWLRAALTTVNVVQGTSYITNPFRRIFAPRAGQTVQVTPTSVKVYGAARSFGPHPADFLAVELSYDEASRKISLVMNEERRGVSVPLSFTFLYKPEQGYAPIHEVVDGRNRAIKDFYWRLWFGDNEKLPEIPIDATFTAAETTVDAATIQRFCDVVGNQGESFKSARNETVSAPMDYAIVLGWESIMKTIFPSAIDGDLVNLVHLSNGFRMLGAPLRAGESATTEARVTSVINSDSGKTVKVKGYVLRQGEPVIEVTSAFLYRGRFTDYENTFDTIDEPDYVVSLDKPTSVGVLQSKTWFEWDDDSVPLDVGTTLTFKVKSELRYKDKATFSSVKVTGAAFVRGTRGLVQVATVDYEAHNAYGNPVVEYLKRTGRAVGLPVPLEAGYSLVTEPTTYTTPLTNEPYSKVSGDFNPIHINPYFSDFASLPGTITHGMWSSAATRKYVESVAADNHPERVVSYEVGFVGMVLPGDEVSVALKHIAMRDGRKVVKVEAFNQHGTKVIDGQAEVLQPPTTYVFTGQGSQEQGMGMELYNTSPVARAVWDAADAHLTSVYGFSIVDIVKNNPKEMTIHFGGIKGQAIRQRYMDLTYDTIENGQVKTLPLFSDIDLYTTSYTFSHPQGLLFATQYTQIALVVTEKAAFDDMKAKGLIDANAAFAGHSLGEYSALAAIADVLPISSLADVVFFRGITMQRAVQRDAQGKSQYAMMAVNPSRVGKTFSEPALREIVDQVSKQKDVLVQIVNLNVADQQYVCAGELRALATLTNVLNMLKHQKIDLDKLSKIMSVDELKDKLAEIIEGCWDMMVEKTENNGGAVVLERGFATIPLPGIDVPFHSRYLWPGVLSFRNYLIKKIDPLQLNPDRLVGKYIPNLIAVPFEVTKAYVQRIFDETASPRMEAILKAWDAENWDAPAQRQRLAYNILTECLAYQFASPVRWIETQDVLFTQSKFERFIEVGPSPVLTGMATRTLKAKYEAQDGAQSIKRAILCHAKNQKEVYYAFEDAPEEAEAAPADAASSAPAASAAPAAVAAPVAAAPTAAAAAVEDVPPKAVDTVRIIVAQKLKKQAAEIPLAKSLKELSGGKSTLQNEILGDLGIEFASAPEKGEDLPLDELGAALSVGYVSLGKHAMALTNRMVAGKFPGGFNISAARAHLNKAWGLGPLRADSALFFGILSEPAKRMGSEGEARAFLDGIAQSYASYSGISLSAAGAGGAAGGGGGGGAVMNSEEFDKFVVKQDEQAEREIELLSRYLGRDPRAGEKKADVEKAVAEALQLKLDAIKLEHGDAYLDGIAPVFSALKARTFDSSWNWARQSSIQLWFDIIHGRLDPSTIFADEPRYRPT